MDVLIDRCRRISELKGIKNASEEELKPLKAQFDRDSKVLLKQVAKIKEYLEEHQSSDDVSAAALSPEASQWVSLAERLTHDDLTQEQLLEMAEESAKEGMNCLAIEVARHPCTLGTETSKYVVWKRLQELEDDGKIKPDYNKIIHGWTSH